MLDRNILQDCLLAIGAISHTEITEVISEIYYENLKDLPSDRIERAFKAIIIDGKFPKIGQIRELATGITADRDWHTIVAVASGTLKTATISGISAIALVTAVTSAGLLDRSQNYSPTEVVDKTTIALKKIQFCDNPITLREVRKDWTRLVSVPQLASALAPAAVEITLATKHVVPDFNYPIDDDFSHRAAAMIRCIRDKGSVSIAWLPIIAEYPAAQKREVMEAIEQNNWITPAFQESKLYRKYQSTAEAMREIDEVGINQTIDSVRNLSKTFDKQNAIINN